MALICLSILIEVSRKENKFEYIKSNFDNLIYHTHKKFKISSLSGNKKIPEIS